MFQALTRRTRIRARVLTLHCRSRNKIPQPYCVSSERQKARRTEFLYSIRLASCVKFENRLLRRSVNARGEPRFVARRSVLVKHALLHGLVNRRNRFWQKLVHILAAT